MNMIGTSRCVGLGSIWLLTSCADMVGCNVSALAAALIRLALSSVAITYFFMRLPLGSSAVPIQWPGMRRSSGRSGGCSAGACDQDHHHEHDRNKQMRGIRLDLASDILCRHGRLQRVGAGSS